MAKVTIREVTVSERNFSLRLEFDFTLLGQTTAVTHSVTISKPLYLFWKESADPANDSVEDYITSLVKPVYEAMKKQNQLAVTLALVDKELTW